MMVILLDKLPWELGKSVGIAKRLLIGLMRNSLTRTIKIQ